MRVSSWRRPRVLTRLAICDVLAVDFEELLGKCLLLLGGGGDDAGVAQG